MLSEPSELLKYIDADQLPVQYGGTNTYDTHTPHYHTSLLHKACSFCVCLIGSCLCMYILTSSSLVYGRSTPILEYWGEKAVNDFARKLNAQGGAPKKE